VIRKVLFAGTTIPIGIAVSSDRVGKLFLKRTSKKEVVVKSRTCFKKDRNPRSVYSSVIEAKRSAIYEKNVRGVELVPYKCDVCGDYHLSLKDHVTPSKTCPYCVDGAGEHKELYETREAAIRRATIICKRDGVKLNVYPCPYKQGYHLTKAGR